MDLLTFGTMVFDNTKKEKAVVIKSYHNPLADKKDNYSAMIIKPNGKKDWVNMDDITPID